jgi:hypothetical protein
LEAGALHDLIEAAAVHRPRSALGEVFTLLAEYGDTANGLIPTLVGWIERQRAPFSASRDNHNEIRMAAAKALRKLGAHGPEAKPALLTIFGNGNDTQRELIRMIYAGTDELVRALLPRYRAAFRNGDQATKVLMAKKIAFLKAGGTPAFEDLRAALPDADADLFRALAACFRWYGGLAKPIIPELIKRFDANRREREASLRVLFWLKADAQSAIPALRAFIEKMRAAGGAEPLGSGPVPEAWRAYRGASETLARIQRAIAKEQST